MKLLACCLLASFGLVACNGSGNAGPAVARGGGAAGGAGGCTGSSAITGSITINADAAFTLKPAVVVTLAVTTAAPANADADAVFRPTERRGRRSSPSPRARA